MHVQIVTFNLDISDADYRSACDGLAKAVARVPGHIWMAWLADEPTNTCGGVYTWVDRAAMEDHLHGDFFTAVAADPDLVDFTTQGFDLLEGPAGERSPRAGCRRRRPELKAEGPEEPDEELHDEAEAREGFEMVEIGQDVESDT